MKKLELKVQKYEDLIKLGQLTTSSYDIKTIIKKSCPKISKILNCEKVLVYTLDKKENELIYHCNQTGHQEEIRFKINEKTFVGQCAHYMANTHLPQAGSDIRFARESRIVKAINVKDMFLFPLVSKGELFGVVQALNSNSETGFGDDDFYFSGPISYELTSSLENAILFEKQQKMFLQVVESLADAIGKKDAYTGGHTKRVRLFAEKIGKEMDLSFNEMKDLSLAAVLHDIGKIGIEDKILKKEAPLTDDEFLIMRDHPRLGYEILKKIDGLEVIVDGMRFHHERPDGKGYPYGLKEDEIPKIASIISVADTFDAMISNRPYRKGLSPMIAYEEILNFSGTQFDKEVVEGFKKFFEKSTMYKPSELASKPKAS